MSTVVQLAPLVMPFAMKDWLQPGVTALAALVVIIGMIITVSVQRRASRRLLEQARRSADTAASSAAASDRSARAAEEAVSVNRETAAGVGKRAEADALAGRFHEAATQLGHDKAAVRLAGAYAMGRLADDWPDQRQSCVDVLCAYLRMPNSPETIQALEGEKHVRIAVLRILGDHLDADRSVNWCDCTLDFSYAELPRITWSQPTFQTRPDFAHARFTDVVSLDRPTFEQGATFAHGRFDGRFEIRQAHISGGDVVLDCADVRAGVLTADFLATGSVISLDKAVCWAEFTVECSLSAKEPQGRVALHDALVKPGASLTVNGIDHEGVGASTGHGATSQSGGIINVEPEGHVRLPPTFKEFSGKNVYNDVWKN